LGSMTAGVSSEDVFYHGRQTKKHHASVNLVYDSKPLWQICNKSPAKSSVLKSMSA